MGDTMEKPAPQLRTPILDYLQCVKFVESKLGYEIRDTLSASDKPLEDRTEYRDWWHFILKHRVVHNGCEITIGSDLLEVGNDWQNEITQVFIDEFGDGTEYYVWW